MRTVNRAVWKLLERFCPDRIYLSLMFKKRLGYRMNWKNPKTFNEKLQWMKLYDHNVLYSEYADKITVRDFVKKTIGAQYLIPILGVYDSVDEINYDSLPERFVLKCNHGAKYNIVCKDKASLDIRKTNECLRKWMNEKFYRKKREYHYRNIRPRIVCEQYMEDAATGCLNDYKVFMLNDEPYIIQVDMDRFEKHKRNVYNPEWSLLDVEISYPRCVEQEIPKPAVLDEMLSCAKKLAKGFIEVRVDFYVINKRLYFGEMTFFSGAGFSKYSPVEFERKMGAKIQLVKSPR